MFWGAFVRFLNVVVQLPHTPVTPVAPVTPVCPVTPVAPVLPVAPAMAHGQGNFVIHELRHQDRWKHLFARPHSAETFTTVKQFAALSIFESAYSVRLMVDGCSINRTCYGVQLQSTEPSKRRF